MSLIARGSQEMLKDTSPPVPNSKSMISDSEPIDATNSEDRICNGEFLSNETKNGIGGSFGSVLGCQFDTMCCVQTHQHTTYTYSRSVYLGQLCAAEPSKYVSMRDMFKNKCDHSHNTLLGKAVNGCKEINETPQHSTLPVEAVNGSKPVKAENGSEEINQAPHNITEEPDKAVNERCIDETIPCAQPSDGIMGILSSFLSYVYEIPFGYKVMTLLAILLIVCGVMLVRRRFYRVPGPQDRVQLNSQTTINIYNSREVVLHINQ